MYFISQPVELGPYLIAIFKTIPYCNITSIDPNSRVIGAITMLSQFISVLSLSVMHLDFSEKHDYCNDCKH